jgi:sirohydrochlorin cobaltochelatase
MTGHIETFLAAWLSNGNRRSIGEIAVRKIGDTYLLYHHRDQYPEKAPVTHRQPTDARSLAKFDGEGAFRPLKSAPTLIKDWLLELRTISEVREALDYFYPAAIGNWLRKSKNADAIVHLRETLDRQTGMYRVTGLIRDDEAKQLVAEACAPEKCLRRILWNVSDTLPLELPKSKRTILPATKDDRNVPEIPVLCCEACNLLVAAARNVVKTRMADGNIGTGPPIRDNH